MRSLHSRATLASTCALALIASAFCPRSDEPDPPAPQDQEIHPLRGVRVKQDGAFPGYTLFAPLQSGTVYLVDMDGVVVHSWTGDRAPGVSVYLLDGGNLLRTLRLEDNPTFHGGGIGGRVQEVTWDGDVVWDYTLSTPERMQHHDVQPLPNGNVLFIVFERMSAEEARAVGRDPEHIAESGFWPDAILEIEPVRPNGGRVVWEWYASDHLVQDRDPTLAFHGDPTEQVGKFDVNAEHRDRPPMTAEERRLREEMEREMAGLGYSGNDEDVEDGATSEGWPLEADWMHTNSVDYHPEHDLVLLSSPRLNEIWIIDHSTTTEEAAGGSGGRFGRGGEVLYRWGNPRNFGAGDFSDQQLFGQHDARWIPPGCPGAGNLLVFDNGSFRPGGVGYSRVLELAPPFDPRRGFTREPGTAFGPREPAWSYQAPKPREFYSFFISGAERLPNGNTLVCAGARGRLFEVTPAGEIVWEYLNPFGGEIPPSFGRAGGPVDLSTMDHHAVFRATRIPLDHPGLPDELRAR